jgi:hypothetical protein
LTADGKVIDTIAEIGHSGPLLFPRAGEYKPLDVLGGCQMPVAADWDGDGKVAFYGYV